MVMRSCLTFVAGGQSEPLWNTCAAEGDRMWRLRRDRLGTPLSVYSVTSALIAFPAGSGLHQVPRRKRSCAIGLRYCGQLGFRGTGQMEWS